MDEVTDMPIETDLPEFATWILPALGKWLLAGLALLTLCGFVGLLWCLLLYRERGWRRFFQELLLGGFVDLVLISGRPVGALAWLTVKEAIGRRVTVVVLIFLLGLLFAGWFLDPTSTEPHRLYLNFVLGTTNYLVLLLMVFLAAFRLPSDIQNKTIYTVLTKPVRTVEIILGQVLGFIVVGSLILGIMWLVSYPFVVRGLYHTHVVNVDELRALGDPVKLPDGTTATALQGWTAPTWQHRHRFFVDVNGNPRVDMERGHFHNVTVVKTSDGKTSYVLGGPEGQLVARVPIYGRLMFRDRGGMDVEKGISVGDEWIYRSYIEGGTEAAGIWTFENLRPEAFPGETIPVEMNIGVFRTHKGDIERGILGSLLIRNPENGLTVELQVFESKEFNILELQIPKTIRKFSSARFVQRKFKAADGSIQYSPAQPVSAELLSRSEYDFFKDFVVNGKVEIWLQCLESGQYFGMAKPDLYIRAGSRSFFGNLFKGYLGIWLQMVVLVGFGVTLSTFLGTPVTLVSTLGVMIAGLAHRFMMQIVTGELYPEVETPWRGGPLESLIRLILQEGVMTDLPQTAGTAVAKAVDAVLILWMDLIAQIIPPMDRLSLIDFVSYGYNISLGLLAVNGITVVGYLIPLVIVGHFFLRSREVAG